MPVIISFLVICSCLVGIVIGQRMVRNRYDFFFRPVQPEDIVSGGTVFVRGNEGSFHKKTVADIVNFGNDWKAIETSDGCRYVLGEAFAREYGIRSVIGRETNGKWISRDELDQYEKTFENPVRQLENKTENRGNNEKNT
ncbi:MAG: hypothetical protein MI863_02015 [Desulfobacterales bacterium]|nr:hypothetical protein [Desulfobacterales bacterium]